MIVKDATDLAGLQAVGAHVARVRATMLASIRAGMTTAELDAIGEAIATQLGARSAPRLMYGFPGFTCISVNNVIAHGIPNSTILKDGDTVNIDVSLELNGYFADTGATVGIGHVSARLRRLLACSLEAQRMGMSAARAGAPVRAIGAAIEAYARTTPFHLVRGLCGHGVGRSLHEDPQVPNFDSQFDTAILEDGMVIAIEPFLTTTPTDIPTKAADLWGLLANGNGRGAQFEHTIVVTTGDPIILTC